MTTSATPAMDVDALVAVDTHVHIEIDGCGHTALPEDLLEASAAYFKAGERTPSLDAIAERYRALRMAAVVFTVDAEAFTGQPALSNEEIAEGAARNADALIAFASVDPAKGRAGARTLRRLVEGHGMRGAKFHPSLQGFSPDDRRVYPVFEEIESLGVPAIFHTGQTGIGAGLPGGAGIKLSLSNPMLLDTLAADLPGLQIVMAHPSFPWQDEALSVATHKSNVWIDLSGWSPKYFPPQLVRYANSLLQDKILFGSDYPLIPPDRWLADFDALDIKPHVRQKIVKDNAVRLLGLTTSTAPAAGVAPRSGP